MFCHTNEIYMTSYTADCSSRISLSHNTVSSGDAQSGSVTITLVYVSNISSDFTHSYQCLRLDEFSPRHPHTCWFSELPPINFYLAQIPGEKIAHYGERGAVSVKDCK